MFVAHLLRFLAAEHRLDGGDAPLPKLRDEAQVQDGMQDNREVDGPDDEYLRLDFVRLNVEFQQPLRRLKEAGQLDDGLRHRGQSGW